MKKIIASLTLALAGVSLTGCDPAIPACSNSKPVSSISLRSATISSGIAVCDGVTDVNHYFWHIRLSDGKRTYLNIVPR